LPLRRSQPCFNQAGQREQALHSAHDFLTLGFSGAKEQATNEGKENSAEIFHVQTATLNDAFQSADGNGFAPVHGHDHLSAIFMALR
jgi:hypothetical protein